MAKLNNYFEDMAAEGNHVDVIQYLLSLKIDINQLNNFGETALHRASIRFLPTLIIKTIITL